MHAHKVIQMAKKYKTVRIEQEVYQELMKAKALLMLMEGENITLSETIRRALNELPKIDLKGEISKTS